MALGKTFRFGKEKPHNKPTAPIASSLNSVEHEETVDEQDFQSDMESSDTEFEDNDSETGYTDEDVDDCDTETDDSDIEFDEAEPVHDDRVIESRRQEKSRPSVARKAPKVDPATTSRAQHKSMSNTTTPEKSCLSAQISKDLHMRLKLHAVKEGLTIVALIEELISTNCPA